MIRATVQDSGGEWFVVVTYPDLDRPGRFLADLHKGKADPATLRMATVNRIRDKTWQDAAECCARAGGCL